MILFIKNIDIEGPDTLGPYFEQQGYRTHVIDLSAGGVLPSTLEGVEAVIVLGGPMNVYEEDRFPYLREEDRFIRKVLQEDIPYLGICLGSQLLAKAAGARVGKSPSREIGFDAVRLTDAGRADPLFAGLPEQFDVFQWHEDMFDVPDRGILLSSSSLCPHQAVRVGENAYGLQFHVEITDKSIREWSDRYFQHDQPLLRGRKEEMLAQYRRVRESFHDTAGLMFRNFAAIVAARNGRQSHNTI